MKNYQKLTVALMGILLTAGTATMISAHAEEPMPTDICIEPYWHMYELTDMNLQVGDTLHLEFAGDGVYDMEFEIMDEENNTLYREYVSSDENDKVKYDYIATKSLDSVKVYTMVFSDNDAELVRQDVTTKPQVVDIVLLSKYLHGKQNITQKEFTKLDRNYDNRVNIYDFIVIKQELIKVDNYMEEVKLDAFTEINDTASVTVAGWDSAMSDTSYVFESFEQFDEVITPLFKPAIIRSLEKTYDEKFFEKNNLCMKLWAQNPDDDFHLHISDVAVKNGTLHIDYEKGYMNDSVGEKKVLISQIGVPKNYCDDVVWGMKDTQPIAYEYAFDGARENYYSQLEEIEPKLICSYEELLAYADTLDYFQKETALEKYTEEFFETKAVYLRPVIYTEADSSEQAWNVRKQGDTITADIKVSRPPTDNLTGTIGLGQLIINKSDAENATVSCRECEAVMISYNSNETFDGEMLKYTIPEKYVTLVVNQYSFKKEYAIDFYWFYKGSGGSGYKFIDSVEIEPDFKPFTGDTEAWDNACEGENFSISYNEENPDIVTVTFRKSADSDEFVTKEFEIQDMWR